MTATAVVLPTNPCHSGSQQLKIMLNAAISDRQLRAMQDITAHTFNRVTLKFRFVSKSKSPHFPLKNNFSVSYINFHSINSFPNSAETPFLSPSSHSTIFLMPLHSSLFRISISKQVSPFQKFRSFQSIV